MRALDGESLAKLEDILELYAQPSAPDAPRICRAERPCQLLNEVLAPLPPKPGTGAKQDDADARNGTAGVLLAYNLDTGQRDTDGWPPRTKVDSARFGAAAIAHRCPTGRQVRLIQAKLHTHPAGAGDQACDAPTARRWVCQLEFDYTPKHASGRNMAELAGSALAREGLDRRIGCIEAVAQDVAAWTAARSARRGTSHWSGTGLEARATLQRHYQQVFAKT